MIIEVIGSFQRTCCSRQITILQTNANSAHFKECTSLKGIQEEPLKSKRTGELMSSLRIWSIFIVAFCMHLVACFLMVAALKEVGLGLLLLKIGGPATLSHA